MFPPPGEQFFSTARQFSILATALLWLLLSVANVQAEPELPLQLQRDPLWRHVLYLNSYQNGYSWSDTILVGAREAFQNATYSVDLQVEYLDAKKYSLETTQNIYTELFKKKFEGQTFHAVMVSDNNAYDYILTHGDELFPGVPVVFSGINDFKAEDLIGKPNITGVLEYVPARETLEVARKLHPYRPIVHVLGDTSLTSRAITAQVREAATHFSHVMRFSYHEITSFADLNQVLKQLDDQCMIFFIPFYIAEGGHSHTVEDVLEYIYNNTSAPIYTSWLFFLGHGALGGRLLDGRQQGHAAAEMVVRIFDGERPRDIPVLAGTPNEFIFDYNVMKKLHIRENMLPKGSLLINEPSPFYELDKQVFWTLMGSMAAMGTVLVLLARTIVQRRRVEQQVVDQLSFMRLLMDNIPQLVYWKDNECRYVGANKSFVEFFHLGDPESVVGLTNRDLMSSDHYAVRGEAEDRQVMAVNQPKYKMIWNVDRRDDVPVTLEVSKVPLHDKSGAVVGVLSSAEDITRRVSLERQLLQSQKMEAIGAFASGIAHDFNNLLTTITNSIELAMLDIPPEAEAADDSARALKAARQGRDLVRQLLTYTRPTREGLEPTDVARVVRDAVSLVRASLPAAIRLEEDLPDELPLCLVNPAQIRQIVMNLCSNAYQAMRQSGGIITVTLDLVDIFDDRADVLRVAPGPYLRLAVQDTGPGIPPEILNKIFDPFFTTKDKGEGTGLGLAVVQGIVAAHKGTVTLSSTPHVRTVFDIFLPFLEEDAVLGPVEETRAVPGTQSILFLEDNQDQLRTIPRALARLGYTVQAFPAAAEALEAMAGIVGGRIGYDVVVTDYDMPDINGAEFARALEQLFPDIPVIMVSGRGTALEAARNVPAIKHVLLKPYNVADLTRVIQEVVGKATSGAAKDA
ncbi:hybrid sensor histidine kinase/response regulator [Megalodesulfovibrio gigas]|uniref:histidine kinase n=1 Tax=Megalodesulfovibrio gigas (strain ATCC 19364 / DSM 1382 / NCIMB 9332 / VKM B-1759) TaxID=1121448 RepID=T2G784_MEGG1|nr:ABC transporter substrate binding protein [Megalodesulfovibrio gigas]AGW12460.1 putative PAS/PAC sensor hybrid histidine kinase [Megalodesulfovibrio gigas DSM 1382 = ATCC 19364]